MTEVGVAGGTGAAFNAVVKAESNVERLNRELAEALAAEEAAAPGRRVDNARAKLARAQRDLAQAEAELEAATAAAEGN